jgi:hypothetical protein
MLDPCPSSPVATPPLIPHDSVTSEHRRDELGHASVAAVGEDTAMALAQHLHV